MITTSNFDAPVCPTCKKRPCSMISCTNLDQEVILSFADECSFCLSNPPLLRKVS